MEWNVELVQRLPAKLLSLVRTSWHRRSMMGNLFILSVPIQHSCKINLFMCHSKDNFNWISQAKSWRQKTRWSVHEWIRKLSVTTRIFVVCFFTGFYHLPENFLDCSTDVVMRIENFDGFLVIAMKRRIPWQNLEIFLTDFHSN